MRPKIKISELPDFDAAEFLQTDADIAAYLNTVLEENDAGLLAAALGDRPRPRHDPSGQRGGHHPGSTLQSPAAWQRAQV